MRAPSIDTLLASFRDLTREQARLIRKLAKAADYTSDIDLRELIREHCQGTFAYSQQCFHDPFAREMWRRTMAFHAINGVLGTHGVEALGEGRASEGYDPPYQYMNAGDPYVATLVYTLATDTLRVACWGDIAERIERPTSDSNFEAWRNQYND